MPNVSQINKIFVIGLPRTGSTSLCEAMLGLNFRVAHTAYTIEAIRAADVIADVPAFNDFEFLHSLYPNARFIYLERQLNHWLPSIQKLLLRMQPNLFNTAGGFDSTLKRCYFTIFENLSSDNMQDGDYLVQCYLRHQQRIKDYFNRQNNVLMPIKIEDRTAYQQLLDFLQIDPKLSENKAGFKQLNRDGRISSWNSIKHPLKISSHLSSSGREFNYHKFYENHFVVDR